MGLDHSFGQAVMDCIVLMEANLYYSLSLLQFQIKFRTNTVSLGSKSRFGTVSISSARIDGSTSQEFDVGT